MIRWVAALFLLLIAPAHTADITVLRAGAISSVAGSLAPAFETARATGLYCVMALEVPCSAASAEAKHSMLC